MSNAANHHPDDQGDNQYGDYVDDLRFTMMLARMTGMTVDHYHNAQDSFCWNNLALTLSRTFIHIVNNGILVKGVLSLY